MTDLNETILEAARKSGLSMLQMSKRARIPYSGVHRWYTAGGGLTIETANRLCELFALELRPARKRKGR
ncbi:MAG: hypothetical protein JXB13_11400 [Phycisphaerae bacterium]|nr:hypothetical protein [Phycisphaerae bacterium]